MQFIIYLDSSSDAELTGAITFKLHMSVSLSLSICLCKLLVHFGCALLNFYWNVPQSYIFRESNEEQFYWWAQWTTTTTTKTMKFQSILITKLQQRQGTKYRKIVEVDLLFFLLPIVRGSFLHWCTLFCFQLFNIMTLINFS